MKMKRKKEFFLHFCLSVFVVIILPLGLQSSNNLIKKVHHKNAR